MFTDVTITYIIEMGSKLLHYKLYILSANNKLYHYAHHSAHMSPENTHKLMASYMEVFILGVILQYMVSAF